MLRSQLHLKDCALQWSGCLQHLPASKAYLMLELLDAAKMNVSHPTAVKHLVMDPTAAHGCSHNQGACCLQGGSCKEAHLG